MSPQRQRMVVIGLGVLCVAGVAFAFVIRESNKRTHPVSALVGPVTAAQAAELVEPLTEALRGCGPSLDELGDANAQTAIALGGDERTDTEVAAAATGAADSLRNLLCADMTSDRRVLGVRDRPNGPVVVVRVVDANGAEYVELELGARKRDRRVVVIDAVELRGGLRASANERAFVLASLPLSRREVERARASLDLAVQSVGLQRLDAARDAIAELPSGFRSIQGVRALELAAADGPDLAAARSRYFADFPDALLVDLLAASDGGDVDAARRALDRIEQRVGADAYLDIHRASVELAAGDGAAAIAAATRATEREPGLRDGWNARLYATAAGGDTAAAVGMIDEIEHRFAVRFTRAQLEADPELATLVASLDYKVWISLRPREP